MNAPSTSSALHQTLPCSGTWTLSFNEMKNFNDCKAAWKTAFCNLRRWCMALDACNAHFIWTGLWHLAESCRQTNSKRKSPDVNYQAHYERRYAETHRHVWKCIPIHVLIRTRKHIHTKTCTCKHTQTQTCTYTHIYAHFWHVAHILLLEMFNRWRRCHITITHNML